MKKVGIILIMTLLIGVSSMIIFKPKTNSVFASTNKTVNQLETTHGADSAFDANSINYEEFDPTYFSATYSYKTSLKDKISVIVRRNGMMDYWVDGVTVLYDKKGNAYNSGSQHKDFKEGSGNPGNVSYSVDGVLFKTFHHSSTILQTYYYGDLYDNVQSIWTIKGSK